LRRKSLRFESRAPRDRVQRFTLVITRVLAVFVCTIAEGADTLRCGAGKEREEVAHVGRARRRPRRLAPRDDVGKADMDVDRLLHDLLLELLLLEEAAVALRDGRVLGRDGRWARLIVCPCPSPRRLVAAAVLGDVDLVGRTSVTSLSLSELTAVPSWERTMTEDGS
jgi:hypothetical protein